MAGINKEPEIKNCCVKKYLLMNLCDWTFGDWDCKFGDYSFSKYECKHLVNGKCTNELAIKEAQTTSELQAISEVWFEDGHQKQKVICIINNTKEALEKAFLNIIENFRNKKIKQFIKGETYSIIFEDENIFFYSGIYTLGEFLKF